MLFFYCPIFLLINGQTGVTKVVSGVIFFSIGTLFLYLFIMKSRTLKADFIEWRFIMGYLFLYFILYYVIAIGICMLLSILGVISYQIGWFSCFYCSFIVMPKNFHGRAKSRQLGIFRAITHDEPHGKSLWQWAWSSDGWLWERFVCYDRWL